MAVIRNTAEGQTSGTVVSAANSGGGSGTAFDQVAITGTTTRVFSNSTAMHGAQSYALASAAATSITLLYSVTGDTSGAQQMYCFFTSYPDTGSSLMTAYISGARAGVSVSNSGRLLVSDDLVQIDQSAAGAIPLYTWVRVDMCATVGATTSTGRVQAALSLGDSTTAIYSYDSGFTVNTGTSNFTSYRFGKLDVAANCPTFFVDSIGFDSGATSLMMPYSNYANVAWFRA